MSWWSVEWTVKDEGSLSWDTRAECVDRRTDRWVLVSIMTGDKSCCQHWTCVDSCSESVALDWCRCLCVIIVILLIIVNQCVCCECQIQQCVSYDQTSCTRQSHRRCLLLMICPLYQTQVCFATVCGWTSRLAVFSRVLCNICLVSSTLALACLSVCDGDEPWIRIMSFGMFRCHCIA